MVDLLREMIMQGAVVFFVEVWGCIQQNLRNNNDVRPKVYFFATMKIFDGVTLLMMMHL